VKTLEKNLLNTSLLLVLGMEETEVTTSQADSSDADIDDDDADVDDDDDSEWLNIGSEVSRFTNTDVLTTRRVSISALFFSLTNGFHRCIGLLAVIGLKKYQMWCILLTKMPHFQQLYL